MSFDPERELDLVRHTLRRLRHSAESSRRRLHLGLECIVSAAFGQPASQVSPRGYAQDLCVLNDSAKWSGRCRQVDKVRAKFFGGDPSLLEDDYVLMVSLNHAYSNAPSDEYSLLNDRRTHFDTCAGYFRSSDGTHPPPHYRGRFFDYRAEVLSGYVSALPNAHQVLERGRFKLLEHYSFYLERYPTWSERFRAPRAQTSNVFCLELNRQVLPFVLDVHPPRAVLLAGKASAWDALNDVAGMSRDWSCWREPKTTRDGVVRDFEIGRAFLRTTEGKSIPVLRVHALKTTTGPNTPEDCRRLGRILRSQPSSATKVTSIR